MASTPDGRGYWEAAADGAVFSFGDAVYSGRADSAQPVVGITASGPGYRLVASDGGIFDFGGAVYDGSYGGRHLNRPMIGMASTAAGYLTVASDGGIFTYRRRRLLRLARREHRRQPGGVLRPEPPVTA